MKAKDILAVKGSQVITVEKGTLVIDAVPIFSTKRVGSLLIVDKDNNILGIIGARDILLILGNQLGEMQTLTVEEIMTTNLIVGTEDDHIDYLLAVMTENRIRHIPIFSGSNLIGIISIGDVVKSQLKAKDVENKYLKDYIADKYPG